ncbi:hypothetical protein Hanom_Chr12g01174861 [Helianthus anomalus]
MLAEVYCITMVQFLKIKAKNKIITKKPLNERTQMNINEHITETFMSINEQTQPLLLFICLSYGSKFLVHVCSFIKQTNINELPVKQFTNCSLNVRFVYSPTNIAYLPAYSTDHF